MNKSLEIKTLNNVLGFFFLSIDALFIMFYIYLVVSLHKPYAKFIPRILKT